MELNKLYTEAEFEAYMILVKASELPACIPNRFVFQTAGDKMLNLADRIKKEREVQFSNKKEG